MAGAIGKRLPRHLEQTLVRRKAIGNARRCTVEHRTQQGRPCGAIEWAPGGSEQCEDWVLRGRPTAQSARQRSPIVVQLFQQYGREVQHRRARSGNLQVMGEVRVFLQCMQVGPRQYLPATARIAVQGLVQMGAKDYPQAGARGSGAHCWGDAITRHAACRR